MSEQKSGVELIALERGRQLMPKSSGGEGWTYEHDDGHVHQELAMVAGTISVHNTDEEAYPEAENWGIIAKHETNRIKQLVIAGALIAAEIDRLQRLKQTPPTP